MKKIIAICIMATLASADSAVAGSGGYTFNGTCANQVQLCTANPLYTNASAAKAEANASYNWNGNCGSTTIGGVPVGCGLVLADSGND